MAKLDLKNTIFVGKVDTAVNGITIVVFPPETRKILGLKGQQKAHFKKFPGGCSRGNMVGVKLKRDAFDYEITEIVSVNGVLVNSADDDVLPDAPTP